MPRMMNVIYPMEFIIQPKITYILFEDNLPRRIYTDGRSWPAEPEPSFAGYSIGHWVDEAGEALQSARDRDPLHEGPAHVRGERTAAARGQPDGRQGAHLPRQGEARAFSMTGSPPSIMRSPTRGR